MGTLLLHICRSSEVDIFACMPCFDQTVAVLMKNKERAADIGTAERRILQPQVARRMAQMNAAKKAEFDKQVQQEVERVVYAAKRRFVRRQAKLDEAGVFHPEANAHRFGRFGTLLYLSK